MKFAKAPVVIFGYNRPQHLSDLLESLKRCPELPEHRVIFYLDGAKGDDDKASCKKVLEISQAFLTEIGNGEVIERPKNWGLANNIITGLNEVSKIYPYFIVLEDDLICHEESLKYFQYYLQLFKEDPAVATVAGYVEPVSTSRTRPFFLPKGTSWGWASWGRFWQGINWDTHQLLALSSAFPIDQINYGGYNYMEMLKHQHEGIINSWGIRFYIWGVINGLKHVTPPVALVVNRGFDESGIHCNRDERFQGHKFEDIGRYNFYVNANEITENTEFQYEMRKFYSKTTQSRTLFQRVVNRLKHNNT